MLRRHAWDSADSDLFERQEAALSRWAEELRRKQRLFAEREHVFEGTRLALGGARRRCGPPPAASPALEHSPRRVGVTGQPSAARPPAAPLLTRPPAVLHSSPSTSPCRSDSVSHLGSAETLSLSGSAVSAREKQGSRRRRSSCLEQQYQSVSKMDFFLSPPPETVHHPPNQKTVYCDVILDYPSATHLHTASKRTALPSEAPIDFNTAQADNFSQVTISSPTCQPVPVSSAQATVKNIPAPKPVSITHPVIISTPIRQPTPTPVPAPRTRAAVTQSTPAPVPVPWVGVTVDQPPPVPVPVPRLRVARVRPDPPRGSAEALQPAPSRSGGSEELTCPPASSPPHPSPHSAFHALALSLVKLAELSPAQAPALLAQAAALSPTVIQSLAQPLASPTSLHPLAFPVQSVHSPAAQLPAQSVQSPVAQSPVLQSPVVQSPPVLQSPVVQSPPVLQSPVAQCPVLQSPPVQSAQSPPVQSAQSPPAQSAQSPPAQSVQSVVQSPVAQSPVLPPPLVQLVQYSVVQSVQSVVQSPGAQSPVLPPPLIQLVQSSVVQYSVVQSVQSVVQSPVAQSPVAQSSIQSLVQSLIHHPVQFPDLQPQPPEPAVSSPVPQQGACCSVTAGSHAVACCSGTAGSHAVACSCCSGTAGFYAVACSCCSATFSLSTSDSASAATFRAADWTSSPERSASGPAQSPPLPSAWSASGPSQSPPLPSAWSASGPAQSPPLPSAWSASGPAQSPPLPSAWSASGPAQSPQPLAMQPPTRTVSTQLLAAWLAARTVFAWTPSLHPGPPPPALVWFSFLSVPVFSLPT
ncbi:hypothetical protein ACER0C_002984 [Sarotherodon galilaeus]